MPKKNAAEFYYDEKRKLYRKRIKDQQSGKWYDVYGRTKAECREKCREKEAELANVQRAKASPAVWEYAKTWYALHTVHLTEKGKEGIRNAINNHILPCIGEKLLAEVTHDDALSVMAAASEKSNETQKRILNVLRRIFESAVDNGLIDKSPAKNIKAGGKKTAEKIPLTAEQQARLIAAVRDTRAWPFVMLGLYAGLRREEALGLQWDCVHLDVVVPYISVRRSLIWEKGKVKVSEDLKSAAARRDIPIPPQLVDCLRSLEHAPSGHIITDTSGQPCTQASFRRLWGAIETRTADDDHAIGETIRNTKIVVTLDFHVTPHLLRHTYITSLIMAGANVKTVQYLAGHSSVQLTLDIYTHLVDTQPAFTAGAVMAAFAPPKKAQKGKFRGKKYRLCKKAL